MGIHVDFKKSQLRCPPSGYLNLECVSSWINSTWDKSWLFNEVSEAQINITAALEV